MAQMRRENTRVIGRMVGSKGTTNQSGPNMANMTPEQKAQRARDTEKAYLAWKAEREARIERNKRL